MSSHSLSAIAKALSVSTRTVAEWIRTGELKAVSVSRSRTSRKPRLRVTDESIAQFLASRTVGGEPKTARRSRRRAAKPVKEYV